MWRACPALLLALLVSLTAARAQVITSNFNVNDDGWTQYANGDPSTSLTYTANGGVGGSGAIILVDPANGKEDYFLAPAKFLGNLSSYYGGTLGFDLKLSPNWTTVYTTAMVVLTGTYNSSPVSIGYTPPSSQYPNATSFTSYSFTLSTSLGWKEVNTSNDTLTATTVTAPEFLAVLGSLSALRIWGDWTTSNDLDTLDNVTLTAIPELSPVLLIAATGLCTTWLVKRRKTASRACAEAS